MTGPKLNEKSFVAGERSGTKSTAKYVRSSASKARAVLDLIRGLDVVAADEILQFTDRHIARDVRKVLASAVANAINNDGQEADELYVVACFADEGPTLRRFRPRARGRATRINKRTCHITVIVARMTDDRIEIVQARRDGQGGSGRPKSSATSRRARVERSRAQAADASDDSGSADAEESASDEAGVSADEAETTSEEYAQGDADADGEINAEDQSPHGPGSHAPLDDASEMPEGYPIKGNAQSMLYHEPDSRYYKATKAEVWFDTVESAEAAGFTKPGAEKEAATGAADAADAGDSATAAEGSASDEADSAEENGTADEEEQK
ncbi:MAG: 50S ribosomal protein L22 [Actinomycetota bacterium]